MNQVPPLYISRALPLHQLDQFIFSNFVYKTTKHFLLDKNYEYFHVQPKKKMAVIFRHVCFCFVTYLPSLVVSLTRPVAARRADLTIVSWLHVRDQYPEILQCAWPPQLSFHLHKSDLLPAITNLTCFETFNPFTIRFIKDLICIKYSPLCRVEERAVSLWK